MNSVATKSPTRANEARMGHAHDNEHHEVSLRYMRDKIALVMTNMEIAEALRLG
jgi:hypothetical protein